MSEPEQQATQKAEDFLTPASFIRAAKAAHPAFRFALAVAGILAIVVSFIKFGVGGPATLIFGAIALIGLMVLFLLFAQASKLTKSTLDLPAHVLVWAFLVIAIAIVILLTGSVFFNGPLPFRDWLIKEFQNTATTSVAPSLTSPTATADAKSAVEKGRKEPPEKTNISVTPRSTPPVDTSDSSVAVEKLVILSELTDAYKETGWKLVFFDSWGRSPTLQLLRVKQGVMIATTVDRKRRVSMSVDPRQLPTPQHYNAYVARISSLGSEQAPAVVAFFTAYEQFRDALVSLTSSPADLVGAIIRANGAAREVVTRGHAALCAMGSTPPRLYPDGAFPEPVAPSCSPFSRESASAQRLPPAAKDKDGSKLGPAANEPAAPQRVPSPVKEKKGSKPAHVAVKTHRRDPKPPIIPSSQVDKERCAGTVQATKGGSSLSTCKDIRVYSWPSNERLQQVDWIKIDVGGHHFKCMTLRSGDYCDFTYHGRQWTATLEAVGGPDVSSVRLEQVEVAGEQ